MPNVEKACERFEKEGVKFIKKPNEGKNGQTREEVFTWKD